MLQAQLSREGLMFSRSYAAAAFIAAFASLPAVPANAAGEILITHAKALAGNVTPGDTAGYPVTISVPGKFQLASNLFVAANKIGIQVTSKNVAIDLNGFTLEGSDVAWYGIVGSVNAVTIANGTITQFKFDGIHGMGDYWIVDNLRSIENGRDGIRLGRYALITSSVVVHNTDDGIFVSVGSVIQGNTVSENGRNGVLIVGDSTVVGNVISFNGNYGLDGGGTTGYSGNTLTLNGMNPEATGVVPQHPNFCDFCPL
jgi:hypothetical protein